MILRANSDYSLNSINQVTFKGEKCCVFFEVSIECLNIIKISISFKGLSQILPKYSSVLEGKSLQHFHIK